MEQVWLSIFGLILDALGVLCISFEWFVGSYRRENPDIIEGYSVAPIDRKELEIMRLNEKLADQQRAWERSSRWWAYGLGFFILILGFVFQILGNWPGGIFVFGLKFH